MLVGVISDTHGLLRPEVLHALDGVEQILHAGDVGDPAILERLRAIAPVIAIRGNIDEGGRCGFLPAVEVVELGGCSLYMLHDRHQMDLDPTAAEFAVVISGHSHQPLIEWQRGTLFFNPGSAGPRRFNLPVTIGKLTIVDGAIEPAIVNLDATTRRGP